MRIALLAATAVVALSPLTFAVAQSQLPATTITAPKPAAHPVVASIPADRPAMWGQGLPSAMAVYPDPNVHVRAKDWNALGVLNLHFMTDAQFAAFEAAHPNAVIVNRCFLGEDPDLQIRSQMRRAHGGAKDMCG
jgi:hypothetical protein